LLRRDAPGTPPVPLRRAGEPRLQRIAGGRLRAVRGGELRRLRPGPAAPVAGAGADPRFAALLRRATVRKPRGAPRGASPRCGGVAMKPLVGSACRLLAVATLGMALGSVALPAAAAEEQPGRVVFVSKGCATCHEERAVLQAPHLSVLRKDRSLFQLSAGMWNHAPLMWANLPEPGLKWPRLSSREMAVLGSYLNGSEPKDPPPDREHGQVVLVSKGCLTCHALGGPRGTAARDLAGKFSLDSDAAWAAALWNHAPTMIAMAAEKGIAYPSIEWKELVDLVGFLRTNDKHR